MDFTTREGFAIRLCEAAHPHRSTSGLPVPCGDHRRAADFMHVLTTREGDALFMAIVKARSENIERARAEARQRASHDAAARGEMVAP